MSKKFAKVSAAAKTQTAEVKAPEVKTAEVKAAAPAAEKAETMTPEVKPAVKETVKKEEPVKEIVKEAAKEAREATEAVKTTAAKAVKKAAAKTKRTPAVKEKAVPEVVVEYNDANGEHKVNMAEIVDRVKALYVADGHRESSIKSLQVYVKPQDYKAYYVINGKIKNDIDLF